MPRVSDHVMHVTPGILPDDMYHMTPSRLQYALPTLEEPITKMDNSWDHAMHVMFPAGKVRSFQMTPLLLVAT